ncbi:Hypothetical predicted protein [Pelobates cultripes]|uniref:Uncharacterized protein n=1 Tax=Pelobates cultripes TaxID=61616 RepID=A0AAD1WLX9_PELCU|nr:Hypothetical predicted protein [Pelobates cultripes]
MLQPKQKRQATKAEKQNLFGQNAAPTRHTIQPHQQDGGEETHDGNPFTDLADQTMEEPVTKQFLLEQLGAFSSKMMAGWEAGLSSLKKDIRELGARTSRMEERMEETQEAHNHLIDQVNTLQATISTMENKLMDIEDRARRNNLRLQGIPETDCGPPGLLARILPCALTGHAVGYATPGQGTQDTQTSTPTTLCSQGCNPVCSLPPY